MDDRPVHATTYDSGEFNKTATPAGDHALPTTETNSTQPGIRTERGADRTMPYLLGFRHGSLARSRGQTLLPATNDVGAARKHGGAVRLTVNGRTRPPDEPHPVRDLNHASRARQPCTPPLNGRAHASLRPRTLQHASGLCAGQDHRLKCAARVGATT